MNKIYKVMYSKVKQCCVVVSEIAKSHGHNGESSGVRKHAALTAAVLIALGSLSFTTAFVPMTAEAATTRTAGSNFVGVERTDGLSDENDYDNYGGKGANGADSITLGLRAKAGEGTITIGDRNAGASLGSVYVGQGDIAKPKLDTGGWVTSIGYNSDATGYGSIALGSNAVARNSYALDSKGESLDLNPNFRLNSKPDIQRASVAIGYGANADNGNIAIGSYSDASTDLRTAKTKDGKEIKSYLTDKMADSYVSVGDGKDHSETQYRRISNVADGAADTDVATIAQLKKVADNKVAWKLTTAGDSNNASTVSAGDTVDFSAAKDSKGNGQATGNDHSNLTISKENGTNKVNMTVGLSNNVVLGQNDSGKGGSLDVYRAVGDASSDKETNEHNQSYDQLGSHVRIDGSTVSVHYDNGTDSDARGAVLGIANDSYNYKDTDNKDTDNATKTVDSPLGYLYLQDGKNYYYVHGTMANDPKALQGRLVYNSSESGYNYIANLDDGIKFSGDVVDTSVNKTNNTTADTRLNPVTESTTKNINTMSITGGIKDSSKLTNNNIGVVVTPTVYDGTVNNNVTSAGGLSIQLAKDLTGITSISNQPTSATTTTGAKIELGTNGTTISGGDVNVSKNKITGLKDGTDVTDAATVGQVDAKIKAANKYYSVKNGVELTGNTNENNLGASAIASMAAGYTTGTAGIASTVVGSYSGVIGSGLQGAAAVSVGTVNVNKNTGTSKKFSGVANSIVGQANMTTDSNAAIIVGAGNSVTNSYRDLDTDALSAIQSAGSVSALKDALQSAVPKSGAQVMVMGGGNNVESAYMSQVVGVGNTVTGTDSTYAEGTSTQYNFVDGFQNELTNGKHDYIIGSNNTVSGDSIDKNQSNIVFGDNHKLTNQKNNVIIGSSDTADDETTASDVVAIGHNAKVSAEGGVAIGSGSEVAVASTEKVSGYDPTTKTQSADKTSHAWNATTGAVSIGTSNGTVTRQINGVAAGTNDTDAVNVAQLKKLAGMKANVDASNIGSKLKNADGEADATDKEKLANENAWGAAIGTGKVADPTQSTTNDPTQNGSQQLVTGGEVYNALHGGLTDITVGKDGKDGTDGKDGSIGLNGKDGKDGITTTIIKTEKGQPGEKGETGAPGVDGTDITRIVYQNDTNGDDKHTVATLDDGMKYVGDTGVTANVKLDHQLKLSGTTFDEKDENKKYKEADWTSNNIAVVSKAVDSDGNAVMNLKLAKDLKDLNSSTYTSTKTTGEGDQQKTTTYTTVINGKGLTIQSGEQGSTTSTSGPSITIDGINAGGKAITNLKDGALSDSSTDAVTGKQLYAEQKARTDADTKLTSDLSAEKQARETADTAINNKLGTLDANGNYIQKDASVSSNLNTLDTQVKANADAVSKEKQDREAAITNITNNMNSLTDSAVQYDKDSNKGTVTLAGADGTTIKNLKAGEVAETSKDAVNGSQLYAEQKARTDADTKLTSDLSAEKQARETADTAINNKLGTLDANGNYIQKDASVSSNLNTLDTQVKANADAISKEKQDREAAITNITNDIGNLSDSAVKYDADTNKTKITLAGEGGTTITNLKDGALSDSSTDAVNGKQLYNEQQEREKADAEINQKVTNNTNEITEINNGNFTDASKTAIHNIAKDAVKVVDGENTKVTKIDGTNTTPTTYAVNVEGNGKVDSGDTGLISGGTLYNEVHVDKDGTYIKSKDSATGKDMTVAQNLSALDSGLKTTSDLIHTNTKGDTIQIGGSDAAKKIDVNGKDGKGRVITGVVSDANDPTSAANVGYVNGLTAANTQQIYRDMNNAYGRLNNNINKAAAGSNALAALHPLDYDPDDKADFAVGYGHYRNANAAAVGAFYHPNENTMVNVGVSLGNGDPGFNAGVSFKVGRGGAGREAMSKTEMAKVINSQSKEIDALKKDNADKDKRIDALEQKMAEILAKLDKNGK